MLTKVLGKAAKQLNVVPGICLGKNGKIMQNAFFALFLSFSLYYHGKEKTKLFQLLENVLKISKM